jgi:hypothetical protein
LSLKSFGGGSVKDEGVMRVDKISSPLVTESDGGVKLSKPVVVSNILRDYCWISFTTVDRFENKRSLEKARL